MSRTKHETIDEYIADCPEEVQPILQKLRETIKEAAPQAEETISYAIPTFKLNGKYLVYFAAFKQHIGFYPPTSTAMDAFKEEIAGYKKSTGTIQFPLDQPFPYDLIKKMVAFRVKESNDAAKLKK